MTFLWCVSWARIIPYFIPWSSPCVPPWEHMTSQTILTPRLMGEILQNCNNPELHIIEHSFKHKISVIDMCSLLEANILSRRVSSLFNILPVFPKQNPKQLPITLPQWYSNTSLVWMWETLWGQYGNVWMYWSGKNWPGKYLNKQTLFKFVDC